MLPVASLQIYITRIPVKRLKSVLNKFIQKQTFTFRISKNRKHFFFTCKELTYIKVV